MEVKKCTSCSSPLAEQGAAEFGCPDCKTLIRRCVRCRMQSVAYICPKCGFWGP